MLRLTFVFAAALAVLAAHAQAPLTLDEARRLALERQPALRALELNERALLVQSAAEGELPDPRLKLGALNFPTRGFPSAREDMTQLAITYEQMVPGLAELTRAQLSSLQQALLQLGPVLSVAFKSVGPAGNDFYDVHFEHGIREFQILLDSDGRIHSARFSP